MDEEQFLMELSKDTVGAKRLELQTGYSIGIVYKCKE